MEGTIGRLEEKSLPAPITTSSLRLWSTSFLRPWHGNICEVAVELLLIPEVAICVKTRGNSRWFHRRSFVLGWPGDKVSALH
jgi:hypothetical protein